MLASFLSKTTLHKKLPKSYRWGLAVILPLWVIIGFSVAQALVIVTIMLLREFGISFGSMNDAVFNTVIAACVYTLTLALVVGVPWWIKKYHTTKEELGMPKLLSWSDIAWVAPGFILYLLASALMIYLAGLIAPEIDLQQVQENGFRGISHYYQYMLAFTTLIIIAPVAEEILFRGYLYGKLRKLVPLWAAMLMTSVLFGLVHGQWNVGIDVFALSMVLCSLREVTGSIWTGILLHMLKNSIAFYLLFINPILPYTMGT